MNAPREGDAANFNRFIQLNRNMLDCYASNGMSPAMYKSMDAATQSDFCFSERRQVEDQLFRMKVQPADFFKAAQSLWRHADISQTLSHHVTALLLFKVKRKL